MSKKVTLIKNKRELSDLLIRKKIEGPLERKTIKLRPIIIDFIPYMDTLSVSDRSARKYAKSKDYDIVLRESTEFLEAHAGIGYSYHPEKRVTTYEFYKKI
jgi:hypothetical protein